MAGDAGSPETPRTRDRWSGGIADNRTGKRSDRSEHNRAGQGPEGGIPAAFLRYRRRWNQRQSQRCNRNCLFHVGSLHP
jgi:hypothetical protein